MVYELVHKGDWLSNLGHFKQVIYYFFEFWVNLQFDKSNTIISCLIKERNTFNYFKVLTDCCVNLL